MSSPVSVVVPTFNNAAHIEATIESILSQSHEDFELIVSDHGSTDDTWERLQSFAADPRVVLDRLSPGGGAERNWNYVTSLAKYDFVKLVCGDDLLHTKCLERQLAALEMAGGTAVMVAARRDLVDTHGSVIARGRGLAGLEGAVDGRVAIRRSIRAGTNIFGEPACVMFRREALEAVGFWEGSDGYVIDLATYFNVLNEGDMVALSESLASFRVRRGQWSVRLQMSQTRQVARLFESTARRHAQGISRGDLLLGRAMAQARSVQRRAAYRLLAHRM